MKAQYPHEMRRVKYLNEIELLNNDKKGYNFLVIISKFLLLLNIQNLDGLIIMEDSFKIYFRRYINLKEHPRHHIFGKFSSVHSFEAGAGVTFTGKKLNLFSYDYTTLLLLFMEQPLLCTGGSPKMEASPGALVLPQYWEVVIFNLQVV